LNSLQREFSGEADFALVYIAEAHASDEWPIGSSVDIKQPTTTAERVNAAVACVADTEIAWPAYVDPLPANAFEALYHPWPIRFFIFSRAANNDGDGRVPVSVSVVHIAEPHDGAYDLADLRARISALCAQNGGEDAV
jgi:Iodothyronine deiodinase